MNLTVVCRAICARPSVLEGLMGVAADSPYNRQKAQRSRQKVAEEVRPITLGNLPKGPLSIPETLPRCGCRSTRVCNQLCHGWRRRGRGPRARPPEAPKAVADRPALRGDSNVERWVRLDEGPNPHRPPPWAATNDARVVDLGSAAVDDDPLWDRTRHIGPGPSFGMAARALVRGRPAQRVVSPVSERQAESPTPAVPQVSSEPAGIGVTTTTVSAHFKMIFLTVFGLTVITLGVGSAWLCH